MKRVEIFEQGKLNKQKRVIMERKEGKEEENRRDSG